MPQELGNITGFFFFSSKYLWTVDQCGAFDSQKKLAVIVEIKRSLAGTQGRASIVQVPEIH